MANAKSDSPATQPGATEQSGSTGRNTDPKVIQQQKDTGQGRYGQSGFAGGKPTRTDGKDQFQESAHRGDPATKTQSNPGSGRPEEDETQKKNPTKSGERDIPKTG